jgi:hypothetical protein
MCATAGMPGRCTPVPNDPDGYYTCIAPIQEATMCSPIGTDQCCTSMDCPPMMGFSAGCYPGPLWFCGGAAMLGNQCAYDECFADIDCKNGPMTAVPLCVPAGAWREPRNHCTYGDCRHDSDCANRPGGQCSPFFDPCTHRFIGFDCTYNDSICRKDSDCPSNPMNPGNPYCAPGPNGATTCQSFVPPP